MIDAVLLLWNRALLDYTKAAATWLRTRNRHDAIADIADQTMNTSTIKHKPYTNAQRIAYVIVGLALALILGPLIIIGTYTVFTSLVSL